jgi:methylated-DNA-[protein]-cysteine S-methyltransferase
VGAPVTAYIVVDSPVGALLLVAGDDGLAGLYLHGHAKAPTVEPGWRRDPAPFDAVVAQLHAYFAGELTAFTIPLDLRGTPFQQSVWQALVDIPYGATTSYGKLAAELGRPGASRAVGLANGRNPVSIIVPCHRVVGASGTLTGYGWGLDMKRQLLDHEQAVLARR